VILTINQEEKRVITHQRFLSVRRRLRELRVGFALRLGLALRRALPAWLYAMACACALDLPLLINSLILNDMILRLLPAFSGDIL